MNVTMPVDILNDSRFTTTLPTINGIPVDQIEIVDHLVQGKMIMCDLVITQVEMIKQHPLDDDIIKKRLVTKLAYELWNENCIEFTKQQNPSTDDVVYRARVFVTPDTNVRVIRELKK